MGLLVLATHEGSIFLNLIAQTSYLRSHNHLLFFATHVGPTFLIEIFKYLFDSLKIKLFSFMS